jgi:hypothetical protein
VPAPAGWKASKFMLHAVRTKPNTKQPRTPET